MQEDQHAPDKMPPVTRPGTAKKDERPRHPLPPAEAPKTLEAHDDAEPLELEPEDD